MRFSLPSVLALLAVSVVADTVPPPRAVAEGEAKLARIEDEIPQTGAAPSPKDAKAQDKAEKDESTVFNGIKVPPMKELEGHNFESQAKEGYWFVKHYSPQCPHCVKIAPVWQKLYEFYYTSKPVADKSKANHESSLNAFHGFYNFHFGSLNCLAFGDACIDHNVTAWPTFVLYNKGKEIKRFEGLKTMENLGGFIEESLDSIKPGSRPAKGFKLPEIGDTTFVMPSGEVVKTEIKPDSEVGETKATPAQKPDASPTKSVLKATKLSKSTGTPNPAGQSTPLTQENFQKLVTQTQEPWFIKFYAPWCHHCQAMAPNWAQMARELQGALNIGEVNCEVEKRLCQEVHVMAYPTIYFFRGGERTEYTGLRGLGDLVTYTRKAIAIGSGVLDVDANTFKEMEETEEVIFLYIYDHATTEEDFQALERLTLSLIGHAQLVKTDSAALSNRFKVHTWPRLLVVRDGRPSYYNALAPKDMRNFRAVLNWMQSVWLPIVPELTVANSKEIMNGRWVVLGILDREKTDEFVLDKRELKNAALEWMDKEVQLFRIERDELRSSKQLRIEEAQDRDDQKALNRAKQTRVTLTEYDRQQIGFAWVDGVFWERWLRTTYGVDVSQGERVIINDEDNKRYWDTSITGAPITPSRTSILDTLTKLKQDPMKIKPKYTTNSAVRLFLNAKGATSSRPALSTFLFIAAIAAAVYYGRRRLRRGRSGTGYFHLDSEKGVLGNGSNGGGKTD